MLQKVFKAFGLTGDKQKAVPYGSGLINHTWKINEGESNFILQRINDKVFKDPRAIAYNINITADYLQHHYPGYLFVKPVQSIYKEFIFLDEEFGYFRLIPFIENSHTIDVVSDPNQAFEAAAQFGKFTALLAGFKESKLKITVPDFHNLSLRYRQFEQALIHGNKKRIQQSKKIIQTIIDHKSITNDFEKIKLNTHFKCRATHHDTKISNVLFNKKNKGLCVIDLDTLMPGYFISDVGDMLRTYLSPVSEEEKNFSKIEIREDYFIAIARGYLGWLKNELSAEEQKHFVYAGKFMIYMQAIRFITDYINNDIYYGAAYPDHNFIRAGNQLHLLNKLCKKQDKLQQLVTNIIASQNSGLTQRNI